MADVPIKDTWRRPGSGAVEGQVEFQAVIVTDVGGKTLSREIQTVPLTASAISTALAPGEYEVREEFADSWATYRIVVPNTTAEQRLLTLRNAYTGALQYAGSAVAALLELLDSTFVSSSELTSAINAAVSPLLGVGAAETLNSISEIALALGNDPQRVANLVVQVSALAAAVDAKYTKPSGGIPLSDLKKSDLDGAFDPLRERFSHSFASATSGMAAPAVSDSGHALAWSGTAPTFGVVGGRGGFYAAPGAQGAATYMTATCSKKPGRGRVRFGFITQGTAGSSVCIAIPSKANLSGSDLTMALHYFSTPTGFEVAVWDGSQSTPKIPIVPFTSYDSPLKLGSASSVPVYEMSFSLKGTTLTFTPADGIARKVTDARLASFGGAFFFAESFAAAFSDHLALVFEAEAGSDSAPYTPVADASAVKARADSDYAPVFPTTGITYDSSGNVATVTENGVTTTYTYNSNGSVATDTRAGVTRTYTYDGSGNLTGIAS